MQTQFGFGDEEILSEEFVLSEDEILAEFWEQCSAAAERGLVVPVPRTSKLRRPWKNCKSRQKHSVECSKD